MSLGAIGDGSSFLQWANGVASDYQRMFETCEASNSTAHGHNYQVYVDKSGHMQIYSELVHCNHLLGRGIQESR
jgi:hypothetical protein